MVHGLLCDMVRGTVDRLNYNVRSQTKLPPNTVFSVLVRLLVLPMLVIAVNSPNFARQH